MELENEVIDTSSNGVADTSNETQATTTTQETQTPYVPFGAGKEKFKINGQEEEWDWDTTKRYAQLGKAGQQAMQKAAALEKKQKDLYAKMREAATQDPESFLEVITGQRRQQATQQQSTNADHQTDPRDLEFANTKQELAQIKQRLEHEDIERERVAIEKELGDAVGKYPEFNSKLFKTFVKQQYYQTLKSGMEDVTLEDIAFLAAQELREEQGQKQKTVTQKLEENKKRAPVITPPGSSSGHSKAMTLDDVKKLAGRA
jgi:hypothetical protein